MCIIFNARVFRAEQTLLINAPIATPPGQPQQWQLIYINSMSSRFDAYSKDGPLMVFAIPNPHGMDEQDFTLFEINGATAASIRLAADTLSDNYSSPFPYSTPQTVVPSFGDAAAPQPKLQVQKIGSYKISVAPSLASLVQRAPWDQYDMRNADVSRILEDMRKRYSASKFAFVIAEGKSPLTFGRPSDNLYFNDTGFGILYRNASVNGCFFPTSHEPKLSPDSGAANETDMDVKLIALGAVIRPLSIATPAQHSGLKIEGSEVPVPFGFSDFRETSKTASFVVRADDSANKVISGKWRNVHSLLSRLPRFGAGEMHRHKYVEHDKIRVATAWNLEGSYLNKDVVARKATNNDVAVVDRMLLDLDSWIYHRTTLDKAVGAENLNGIGTIFSSTAVLPQRWWKVNFALALLARQLADPGINDRISDVVCRVSGEKRDCASVAYLNLDLSDIDLDEDAYAEKDTYARKISKAHRTVDTINSSYIRISATLGPYESLQMRTVSER